jgi:hypothetical protein
MAMDDLYELWVFGRWCSWSHFSCVATLFPPRPLDIEVEVSQF